MNAIEYISFEDTQYSIEKCCTCTKNTPFSHCFIKFKHELHCNDGCLINSFNPYMYCRILNTIFYMNPLHKWIISAHNFCDDSFIRINYSNFVNNELYLICYKLKIIESHLIPDISKYIINLFSTNIQI